MISVQKAEKIILENVKSFPIVVKPLTETYGAVLREIIRADRDQPPFDRATVDGIALRFPDWQNGARRFTIAGVQPAGQKALTVKGQNICIEIMTGAVVPEQLDCVIPVEVITLKNNVAVINKNYRPAAGQFIHRRGSDCRKNTVLLSAGCILGPQQIGVAASVGKSKLKVTAKPRVAIISTGDELVNIDAPLKPFQIRKSNSCALQAIFIETRLCEAKMFHIKDNVAQLRAAIGKILKEFDMVVLSGGVSMGKFDFVPRVLLELGVKVLFYKVSQKPGKPFWFGKTQAGKPVFALPGNPVSTQICAYRYVLPYLKKAVGLSKGLTELAVLSEDFTVKTELTYFLPIQFTSNREGKVWAKPAAISGSGDFAALAKSQGFVELPAGRYPEGRSPSGQLFAGQRFARQHSAGQRHFKRGSLVRLFVWKS